MKKIFYLVILLVSFIVSNTAFGDVTVPGNNYNYDLSLLTDIKDIAPIVIIGSGPAGLAAGLYAGWSKFGSFVIRGQNPGGQLMGAGEVQNIPGIKRKIGVNITRL